MLLHEEYLKLGLNRRNIADSQRWQAGINYRQLARPDRVHDLLRSYGVTHLVWRRDVAPNPHREIPAASELVLFGYALRYGEDRREVAEYSVARLPAQRPPPREPGLVIYAACNGAHAVGSTSDRVIAEGAGGRGAGGDLRAMLTGAEYAVVDPRCQGDLSALRSSFMQAPALGRLTLWVRRN